MGVWDLFYQYWGTYLVMYAELARQPVRNHSNPLETG